MLYQIQYWVALKSGSEMYHKFDNKPEIVACKVKCESDFVTKICT